MNKRYFTVGMAGHIDHGKTALTKALTNVDTDRLKEEKERQISIEPGFAPLFEDDQLQISIIDVPGHERFIRQMIAGVAGIDFVVLVIAADEGVMPQTLEHAEILSFLNIKDGLIALTKVDRADEELLSLVEEHYVNKTRNLWTNDNKQLLEELVSPVPELFRDVARHKIAGKIGEIALEDKARSITLDHIIRGYILATPKRDHKFLRKKLNEMKIDVTPYEHLF